MAEALSITTPDGVVDATLYTPPAAAGARPAVIFCQDGLGVRPALHAMAKHLSDAGYVVLLPNFFYRAGAFAPFDPKLVWTDDKERARLGAIMSAVTPEATMRDVGLFLDVLTKVPNVDATKIFTLGYCMGGGIAFRSMAAHPGRIAASASIHPGNLVTDKPDSPHLGAPSVKGRLYFGCADNDCSCTPEHRAALASACATAGVDTHVGAHAGKGHGFAIDDLPPYDRAASEHHWQRVLAHFAA